MSQFWRLTCASLIAVGLAAFPTSTAAKGHKKAGGAHSMTGCLEKGDGSSFKLTNVEGKGPKTVEIVEAASGVDLAAHAGHKVTITGTSVGAKSAARAEGTNDMKARAEGTNDMKKEQGEHHLRVDAVKMVSASCP